MQNIRFSQLYFPDFLMWRTTKSAPVILYWDPKTLLFFSILSYHFTRILYSFNFSSFWLIKEAWNQDVQRALINYGFQNFLSVLNNHRLKLKVSGSGYFFQQPKVQQIVIHVGYSHVYIVEINTHLFVKVEGRKKRILTCWSTDRSLLMQFGYHLRALRFPDCYKGKGIRFLAESIKLKKGKKKFV